MTLDGKLNIKSKITGGPTTFAFDTLVLGKYKVGYFRCDQTGFIQTETPYWLDEAYASAITAIDLGIITRNFAKAELTEAIVSRAFPTAKWFLDYGGGYGIFTRLMRDRGYDFRHFDIYCENLFAHGFGLSNLRTEYRFDLITAWEVMEHSPDPVKTVAEVLSASDSFLFSTELIPCKSIHSADDWWYFAPETGQHVSLYTPKSLEYLARECDAQFFSDGATNHLITRKSLTQNPFETTKPTFTARVLRKLQRAFSQDHEESLSRQSLLPRDFDLALTILQKQQQSRESKPQP